VNVDLFHCPSHGIKARCKNDCIERVVGTMKCVSAAAMGLAVALATPVSGASYEDTWVLLGLDIHRGVEATDSASVFVQSCGQKSQVIDPTAWRRTNGSNPGFSPKCMLICKICSTPALMGRR
jgi:hypothetical protein